MTREQLYKFVKAAVERAEIVRRIPGTERFRNVKVLKLPEDYGPFTNHDQPPSVCVMADGGVPREGSQDIPPGRFVPHRFFTSSFVVPLDEAELLRPHVLADLVSQRCDLMVRQMEDLVAGRALSPGGAA